MKMMIWMMKDSILIMSRNFRVKKNPKKIKNQEDPREEEKRNLIS